MEKDWLPLEECPQYRRGLMKAALLRYPWEEDDYAFDFEAFYPPLPEGPPWLRKLLLLTKDMVRPPTLPEKGVKDCPFCNPHVDLGFKPCLYTFTKPSFTYPEVDEHPVWAMDPIPDPLHILDHFYGPGVPYERPRRIGPHEVESTKKFLKDLRTSRGYNVDTIPYPGLVNTIAFSNMNLEQEFYFSGIHGCYTMGDHVQDALYCVIDYISEKTGKSYKLVEVLKFVMTKPMALVTFTATAESLYPETFIASLSSLLPSQFQSQGKTKSYSHILECMYLPDQDASLPCYATKPLRGGNKIMPQCFGVYASGGSRSLMPPYATKPHSLSSDEK